MVAARGAKEAVEVRGNNQIKSKGCFQHPTTGTLGAGRDLYGLRKYGGEVPMEIGLSSIETDEGSFVLASIIDITERKQAEQAWLKR